MNNQSNYWPQMIVKQILGGGLQYTVCKSFDEAVNTPGKMIASYDLSFFLRNEHKIQRNLKEEYEQR